MQIETRPIAQFNPAPYNPRRDLKPSDPEYEALVKSIDTFGLVQPLVWNKRTGNLVGGHQRLKVFKARGETEIDVCVVDLSLEDEKALNLALNKVQGGWDGRKLAQLLDDLLEQPEFDLRVT
ncbi:MAG: ParB N-terminal domain-containing protein, partial [Planctomycetota bacterium]